MKRDRDAAAPQYQTHENAVDSSMGARHRRGGGAREVVFPIGGLPALRFAPAMRWKQDSDESDGGLWVAKADDRLKTDFG
jgi:hypothetical protein